jgi:hypothetical protein
MFIGYSEAELSRLLCAASISFPFYSFLSFLFFFERKPPLRVICSVHLQAITGEAKNIDLARVITLPP